MNKTAPISVEWFQRELDRVTVGSGLVFRVAWAPDLRVTKAVKVNGLPEPRDYAKYPIVANITKPYVLGQKFFRAVNGQTVQVGYQKQGGLVVGNVQPTDVSLPDIERVNHSAHIFVIESQVPDEQARAIHEKKRRLSREGLGIDIYKDFPGEGYWDWYADVSEHRDSCCDIAYSCGVTCRGLYRPPDGRDLAEVQWSVMNRSNRPRYTDPETQIEQATRDIEAGIWQYKDKQKEERMQEAREIQRLAVRSIEKTAVYLDPEKVINGND